MVNHVVATVLALGERRAMRYPVSDVDGRGRVKGMERTPRMRPWLRLSVPCLIFPLVVLLEGCGIGSSTGSTSTPTPKASSTQAQVRPTKPLPTVNPEVAAVRAYAHQVYPILRRSMPVFDHAARDARRAGRRLIAVCSYYATRIDFLEGQADGVPHPYMWYTPVGLLHHRMLGVYHHMRGALEGCVDVYATGGNVPTVLSDVAKGAREMHRLASDVWRIMYPRRH